MKQPKIREDHRKLVKIVTTGKENDFNYRMFARERRSRKGKSALQTFRCVIKLRQNLEEKF